ncbi:MAG: leucine-rich repeat protein, partial [Clostridia bacterium]|nr:leucine-rich repeat protein [Clostridia bacterium]
MNGTKLTNLVIPDSVTTIGGDAFSDCTSLTSITIPDGVTAIGSYAFSGCTGLTSVTVGAGVTSIGEFAFSRCTGLTFITIPKGVTAIGWGAFYDCTSLTSITIPDSVTSIGWEAFSYCTGLTMVYYGGTEAQWQSIEIDSGNEALKNVEIVFNHTHKWDPVVQYEWKFDNVFNNVYYGNVFDDVYYGNVFDDVYTTCTAVRTCWADPVHAERITVIAEKIVLPEAGAETGEVTVYRAVFSDPAMGVRFYAVKADGASFSIGDANGDEKIDNKDIVRLKNYLANYDEDSGISSNGTTTYVLSPGADANGDGKVDNKDIVRLKNYLANYDEDTGISSNGTTVYALGPS